jgi:luciferase family oxidoreductase group 1
MPSTTIPLSVLDLALVGEGQSSGDALRAATSLAQHAESLGYLRFWVAEHHGMPPVASTAPAVLLAHIGASTSRIRIGSGGVMLPNHPPLVVAEQFAMLEALHPGRVDLGIGRAPGTDQRTAVALRRSTAGLGVEDFPAELSEVAMLLAGGHPHLSATPRPRSAPPITLLGSSGYSAQLAGLLGLPFAFAHHFAGRNTLPAVATYRKHFRPSAFLDAPHVIVTASVLLADSAAEADHQANPSRLMVLSLRTGRLRPLDTPEEAAQHPDLEVARALESSQIVGAPAEGVAELRDLAAATAADELMITTASHGLAARKRSIELLAEAWALQPVAV